MPTHPLTILLTLTPHGFIEGRVPLRPRPIHVFEPLTNRLLRTPLTPGVESAWGWRATRPTGYGWAFVRTSEDRLEMWVRRRVCGVLWYRTRYVESFCRKFVAAVGAPAWPIGTTLWLAPAWQGLRYAASEVS